MCLLLLLWGQTYKEDISDFLPLGHKYHRAMSVYQDVSGASRLIVSFQCTDSTGSGPDSISAAISTFEEALAENDHEHLAGGTISQVDLEQVSEISTFAYNNIPYFLTDSDYARMDSLLADESHMARQLAEDKQMLMFPVSGLLCENIQRDPLNLFTPVVARLQQGTAAIDYETYDGYIFTPDMSRGIMMLSSPFGASETENNSRLMHLLESTADSTTASHPTVDIHIIGGPAIAVGNAKQIKADSILSVVIAIILIVALLYFSLRSLRNLFLILLSTGWGWLFAMGSLALVRDNVSAIVIGISSLIIGIAVNYPLHLTAHLTHTPDIKSALKEITAPLLVGNITTVGAFLALVPLKSQALRDLGLFSALLLIGTITFVLIFLPHLAKPSSKAPTRDIFSRIGEASLEKRRWLVLAVVLLTIVFGYFSFGTSFDTNMNHINYMTKEQKADMEYFSKMAISTDAQSIYAVYEDTTLEGALDKSLAMQAKLHQLKDEGLAGKVTSCTPFLCPKAEQARRLEKWDKFVERHSTQLTTTLTGMAAREGFAEDSFDEFLSIISSNYTPQDLSHFEPLTSTVFASCLSTDSTRHTYSVVDQLAVESKNIEAVEQRLDQGSDDSVFAFDVASMNSAMANSLSDDFNYIGWACGLIVFLFLWVSLGSIELAMLSFLPMAVSWIWILGIMALLGIQFNVVNVILATFIFGQGDDYTIFMTEGCQYEYAYGKKMIASYKHSIIISALIMFIGIGTLILAKHPALRSLAEVTIVGMFTVVLMAYLFPPLIFKWLVSARGKTRTRPLSLSALLTTVGTRAARLLSSAAPHKAKKILSFLAPGVKAESPATGIAAASHCIIATDSLRPEAKAYIQALLPDVEWADGNAFEIAGTSHKQILPVVLSGCGQVLPEGTNYVYPGKLTLAAGEAIAPASPSEMEAAAKRQFATLHRQHDRAGHYSNLVADRYRYKGNDITRTVSRRLARYNNYSKWVDGSPGDSDIVIVGSGYGEFALLMALTHSNCRVIAYEEDTDKILAATQSACDIAPNLTFVAADPASTASTIKAMPAGTRIFLVEPDAGTISEYEPLNPTIITPANH